MSTDDCSCDELDTLTKEGCHKEALDLDYLATELLDREDGNVVPCVVQGKVIYDILED